MAPALGGSLTNWDDNQLVTQNVTLRKPFLVAIHEMFTSTYAGHYNPLVILSFWLDYQLHELRATGYKTTNVVLHIANSCLILSLFRAWGLKPWVAMIAALIFALHPQRVEAVAWVTERKTVLSSFFFFISLWIYSTPSRMGSPSRRLGLSLVFYGMGCLAKAAAPAYFLLLLGIDWVRGRALDRKALLEKAPFLLVGLLFALTAVHSAVEAGATVGAANRVLVNVLTAGQGFYFYWEKLVLPLWLQSYYPPITNSGSIPWEVYLRAGLVFCPFLLMGLKFNDPRWRPAIFGLVWYTLLFLPVSQLLPAGTASAADRYTYLFHVGILAALGLTLQSAVGHSPRWKRILTLGGGGVFAAWCAWLSAQQTAVWTNSETMWTHNLRIALSTVGFTNRATARIDQRDIEGGVQDLNAALLLSPANAYANANLAMELIRKGELDQAIARYRHAVERAPLDYHIQLTASLIAKELGSTTESMELARRTVALDDRRHEAYCVLAEALFELGNLQEALDAANNSLTRNPMYWEALNIRGQIWQALKSGPRAESDYTEALKIDPGYTEALVNRGILYLQDYRDLKSAERDLVAAVRQDPTLAPAWNALGGLRMEQTSPTAALELFDKALKLEPDHFLYLMNRARALGKLGRREEARTDILKIQRLYPELGPAVHKLQGELDLGPTTK